MGHALASSANEHPDGSSLICSSKPHNLNRIVSVGVLHEPHALHDTNISQGTESGSHAEFLLTPYTLQEVLLMLVRVLARSLRCMRMPQSSLEAP